MPPDTKLIAEALRLAQDRLRYYADRDKSPAGLGTPQIARDANAKVLDKIAEALKSLDKD
jgi:hypothetical protein